jgi:hypothetical protein
MMAGVSLIINGPIFGETALTRRQKSTCPVCELSSKIPVVIGFQLLGKEYEGFGESGWGFDTPNTKSVTLGTRQLCSRPLGKSADSEVLAHIRRTSIQLVGLQIR